jgi:hypothetical protein
MKILYKQLLDLQLWHDYYLGQPDGLDSLPDTYDIANTLAFMPTLNCKRILQNLHWVFRSDRRGAVIFAEVDEVTQGVFHTKIPVDRPYRLLFWLVIRDPYFANFTNLPFTSVRDRLYYFTNLSNNVQGQTLFLTQPLPSYPAYYPDQSSYQLGQLVTYADNTWEAVSDRIPAGNAPDADSWDVLPLSQYASELDQRSWQDFLQGRVIPSDDPQASIPADPLTIPGAWGIVEVVLDPNQVSPAFSLLRPKDGQTVIQPKTYVIRFKNRATHWRYCYQRPHGFQPEALKKLHFQFADDKTYFTQRPQGLLRKPDHFLTDVKDRWLPPPQVTLIKPEIKDQKTAIYSDIYL